MNLLTLRPAADLAESERCGVLFPSLAARVPGGAEFCFLGVAASPVERVVAGAVCERQADDVGVFRWAILPAHRESAAAFLNALVREAAARGMKTLRGMDMVPEGGPEMAVLGAAGFQFGSSHLVWRIDAAEAVRRVRATAAKLPPLPELEVLPPHKAMAAEIWDFLQPSGLVESAGFLKCLNHGVYREFGTVLRVRGVLRGALLAERHGATALRISAFWVSPGDHISTATAAVCLMHDLARRHGYEEMRELFLRGDPQANPAASRLVQRFGGEEVGRLRTYECNLQEIKCP